MIRQGWRNRIFVDSCESMRAIPDRSVQAIVTSPPYFHARDYDTKIWEGGSPDCDHQPKPRGRASTSTLLGSKDSVAHVNEGWRRPVCGACGAKRLDPQIGIEETLEEYLEHLMVVFRECKRVLRDDGVLWLNLDDTYAGSGGVNDVKITVGQRGKPARTIATGFKRKDLMLVPFRVVDALQREGWYVRCDVIWNQLANKPENLNDRPTRSHEYLFLLSKRATYFYDPDAIRESIAASSRERIGRQPENEDIEAPDSILSSAKPRPTIPGSTTSNGEFDRRWAWTNRDLEGSNRRSVWEFATSSYRGEHYATMPFEMARECILAGTSARGACMRCGKPWKRKTGYACNACGELVPKQTRTCPSCHTSFKRVDGARRVIGDFQPQCKHNAKTLPCVVLDPFMGSGTTALAAIRSGRDYVGYELSRKYGDLIRERLGIFLRRRQAVGL